MTQAPPPAAPAPGLANPLELLRSRAYVVTLVFSGLVGLPIAVLAYLFLAGVNKSQVWLYTSLPSDLGFTGTPVWWPLPLLILAGLLVAAVIQFLPGPAGHEPVDGLVVGGGPPPPENLPGIFFAAFLTLSLGGVLGPEAPLIALGTGLAAWAVHLAKKDAPQQAALVIGTAGAFAAISTLLGSPLVGAFLLMEVAGLGGPMLGLILLPGLLAAGLGSIIFIGMDSLTGLGTFSLAIPSLPSFSSLNGTEFLWAIAIGLLGAVLGTIIKGASRPLQKLVVPRRLLLTPVVGAGVALAAMAFAELTHHSAQQVLFSGESALGPLIASASSYTAGALVALVAFKSLAYVLSLSSFRGGPVFPAIFIGAAGGIALSHLGHLPLIAGAAMGMAAMLVAMLELPLTSVMLTVVLLGSDGVALTPLVIVAVVVAFVASARLAPRIAAPEVAVAAS